MWASASSSAAPTPNCPEDRDTLACRSLTQHRALRLAFHPLNKRPSEADTPFVTNVDSVDPIVARRIIFVVNVDWFFLSHRLPLAIGAQQAGADVWVAAADTGRAEEIQRHGLQFVPMVMSRNRGRIGGELATIASLARLYRNSKPDLVHHVTIKPVLYGSVVARVLRIPTVNAISGFGHVFGAGRKRLVGALVERAYRVALHHPRSVTIFQNEEDRSDFTSRGFLGPRQAILIRGSGVDCEVYRPAPEPPPGKVVMFASRMLREKGVEDFVCAARDLRPQYPDVRFVLVGAPDDSPSSVTEHQLRSWHEEGAVEWWGHTSQMEQVLPLASIVALPTYYREGLPKVLLEAAACGLPMITTNVPGCRDVVQADVTGLLVEPHDPIRLAQAMRALLDDDERRQRMGGQARALAERQFSVDGVVDQTLALYRSLLSKS